MVAHKEPGFPGFASQVSIIDIRSIWMSSVLKLIKRATPRFLRRRIKRELIDYFKVPDVEWSLKNMRRLGFRPLAAVDVGAYRGEWAVLAREVFPEISLLMVEAQEGRRPDLEVVKRSLGTGVDYRIALLGAKNGENVLFNEKSEAPTGSSVLADWGDSRARKVSCTVQTLDAVLAQAGMPAPELIKLDVQGYELEVLKGASSFLKHAQAILLEVSLMAMYQNNPLLHEVVAFLLENNFVAYDICTFMRRPLDLALIQADMIFVPQNSPLLKSKLYE